MKTIRKNYLKFFPFLILFLLIFSLYPVDGNNKNNNFFSDYYKINVNLNVPYIIEVPAYFEIINYKNIKNFSITQKYYSFSSFFIKIVPKKISTFSIYFLNTLNKHSIKYEFIGKKDLSSFIDNNIEKQINLNMDKIESLIKIDKNKITLNKKEKNDAIILLFNKVIKNLIDINFNLLKKYFDNSSGYGNFLFYKNVDWIAGYYNRFFDTSYLNYYWFSKSNILDYNKISSDNYNINNNKNSNSNDINKNKYNNINNNNNKNNNSNDNNNDNKDSKKYSGDYGDIISNLQNEFIYQIPTLLISYTLRSYYNFINKIKNNLLEIDSKKNLNFQQYYDYLIKVKYFLFFLKGYKLFLETRYNEASRYFAYVKETNDSKLKALAYFYQAQNYFFLNLNEHAIYNLVNLINNNYYLKYSAILGVSKIFYKEKKYNEILNLYNNEIIEKLFENDKTLLEKIKGMYNINNYKQQDNYSSKYFEFFKDYFYFYYANSLLKVNLKNYNIVKDILQKIKNKNFEFYNDVKETISYIKKNIEDY